MRPVLLIAFHFPPIVGSSGVQRTLRFAQHLPKFGWRPVVLTVTPSAYERSGSTAGNEIPSGVCVHRAFAFDAARQLSLFGRYPRRFALPDRWGTWRHWAIRKALRVIRDEGIEAIWSTFPIATAHAIGLEVSRHSRLPWVAEFRDPMWQGEYPPDPVQNKIWREMELTIAAQANRVVVVTPGANRIYASRFGSNAKKLVLIENGYDEETFQRALAAGAAPSVDGKRFTLLHSGLVYPSERDPSQLFAALAALKKRDVLSSGNFRLVLRASGNDALYRARISALGIQDIVELAPAIDYLAALQEMLTADGLLILQAANCNEQIPAKLYEYIRAGRPVLALTDPLGDTARTFDRLGGATIARLDNAADIERALPEFMISVREDRWRRPTAATVAGYSREALAGRLAAVFDELVGVAENRRATTGALA